MKHLSKQFASLTEAEKHLKIDYIQISDASQLYVSVPPTPTGHQSVCVQESLSPIFHCFDQESPPPHLGDVVNNFVSAFQNTMSHHLKKQVMDYLYKHFVIDYGDFLDLSL